jgi:hypothetical protein
MAIFCLQARAEAVRALAQRESVFADFLAHRVRHPRVVPTRVAKIDASSTVWQRSRWSHRSGALPRKAILARGRLPLGDALRQMRTARLGARRRIIGSVEESDPARRVERVALAQATADSAHPDVMTKPVLHYRHIHGRDAALLMSAWYSARAGDREWQCGQRRFGA